MNRLKLNDLSQTRGTSNEYIDIGHFLFRAVASTQCAPRAMLDVEYPCNHMHLEFKRKSTHIDTYINESRKVKIRMVDLRLKTCLHMRSLPTLLDAAMAALGLSTSECLTTHVALSACVAQQRPDHVWSEILPPLLAHASKPQSACPCPS